MTASELVGEVSHCYALCLLLEQGLWRMKVSFSSPLEFRELCSRNSCNVDLFYGRPLALIYVFLPAMQKLTVPTGLSVTSPHKRTWFIPPLGSARPFPPWMMVAAAVPALLVLILIFMETQITA